ncbi:MAG: hypothetical protein RLZZ292_2470 [Bacteroidota bacterium]
MYLQALAWRSGQCTSKLQLGGGSRLVTHGSRSFRVQSTHGSWSFRVQTRVQVQHNAKNNLPSFLLNALLLQCSICARLHAFVQ